MYTLENAVEDILDFNRLITTKEQRGTRGYLHLQFNLFAEEYKEFLDAMQADDRNEILDGACDTLVTETQYLDALAGGIRIEDIPNVVGYLLSSLYAIDVCAELGMDVDGAAYEVNRSNMTKIPTLTQVKEMYGDDLEEALKAASDYIETKHAPRYTDIYGQVVVDSYGVERVLFKDSNAKLMKPWCFEAPNLDKYLGGVDV